VQVAARSSEWQTERLLGPQAAPGSRWHHAIQWEVHHFGKEIARRSLHPMHHIVDIRHAVDNPTMVMPQARTSYMAQSLRETANFALVPMSSCQSCLRQQSSCCLIHLYNFHKAHATLHGNAHSAKDDELTDARDPRVEGPARDGIQNQPSFNKPSSATFDSALHRRHWTCSSASACSRT